MISLRRIRIENYRSLREVEVELNDLNVLVGPNGVGKTNFLDAIRFLGDTARMDLVEALELRGGFARCLYQGTDRPPATRIRFEIEAVATKYASETAPDAYSLSFWQPRERQLQRQETFTFKRYQGKGRRITVRGGKAEVVDDETPRYMQPVGTRSAALSTLPRLGEQAGATQVREIAQLFQTFRVFDPEVVDARRGWRIEEEPTLYDDAANLASYLLWLEETYPDLFLQVQEDMRHVLPSFRRLHLRQFGGVVESVVVYVEEYGIQDPIPLADASFGTVRGLALLAMLHDPAPPQLTCVEEIDHGLHPYALDVIVDRMRSAATRTQLIVVTHSPALVNRLRPDELIVCERDPETGATQLPAVNADEIAAMTEASDLRLGELWFSGVLGGVPEAV